MNKVKTRFAPSPTGFMHIGNLRSALYAYIIARQNEGEFLLRIEDTDQERLVEGSVENIIKVLNWAGLEVDGEPVIQSSRLKIYREHAEKLIEKGHAYRCFCSKEELETLRTKQIEMKLPPMYDRKCRDMNPEELSQKLATKLPFVVRQKIPLNEKVEHNDAVRGKVIFDTNTLDDHVLIKSDGFPTYHLAVVIDDHEMEITHVIRGEEWLPSVPKHLLLYKSFGWEPTLFAHLPLILNQDRTKLSKRHNNVAVEQYIEKGYLPEALVNFIALLGWNTSDEQEMYSMEDLIREFSLTRVQKAGAIFDLTKLDWFQWQWQRKKFLNEITEIANKIDPSVQISEQKKGHVSFNFASNHLTDQFLLKRGEKLFALCVKSLPQNIIKTRANNELKFAKILISVEEKILKEPDKTFENIDFYFEETLTYHKELFTHDKMNVSKDIAKQAISECLKHLSNKDFDNEQALSEKFLSIVQAMNLKNGQVLWPARVALTAKEFSPGTFEVAYALGYDKTVKRLKDALSYLENLKD